MRCAACARGAQPAPPSDEVPRPGAALVETARLEVCACDDARAPRQGGPLPRALVALEGRDARWHPMAGRGGGGGGGRGRGGGGDGGDGGGDGFSSVASRDSRADSARRLVEGDARCAASAAAAVAARKAAGRGGTVEHRSRRRERIYEGAPHAAQRSPRRRRYALAPVPSGLDTTATATTTTTTSSSSSKIEPPRKRPSVAVYLPATPAGATVLAAAPSSIALSSASSTSSSSSTSSQHRSRVASTSKSPLHPDSPLWSLTSTAVAERHGRISGLRSGWRAWRASATPYTRRSRRSHSLRVLRKRCAAALILWGRVAAAAIAREANVEASLNARRRRHLESALFGKWLPYVCEQVTRRGGKLGDWPAGGTQQVGPSPTRRAEAHYCAASQRAAWGRWAACTDRAEAEASRQHAADRFRDRRGSATAIRSWGRMAASVKALASLLVTAAVHHSCRTLKPSIGRWSSGIRHLAARDQANSLADGSAASACLRRGLRSLRRSAERLAVLREAVEGLDAHAAAFSSASVWAAGRPGASMWRRSVCGGKRRAASPMAASAFFGSPRRLMSGGMGPLLRQRAWRAR